MFREHVVDREQELLLVSVVGVDVVNYLVRGLPELEGYHQRLICLEARGVVLLYQGIDGLGNGRQLILLEKLMQLLQMGEESEVLLVEVIDLDLVDLEKSFGEHNRVEGLSSL